MSSARIVSATTIAMVLLGCAAFAAGETIEQPLSIREDAGKLYVSYDTGRIRVLDPSTLELLDTFTAERRFIPSIWTDDDNVYYGGSVSVATNTSVIVAITKNGENVSSMEGTDIFLSVLMDSGRLYDCQRNGIVEVRSVPDLKILFSANNSGFCGSVRVDDRYVYSTAEKKIIIRDKDDLSKVAEISAHNDRTRALWDDEDMLYSVSDDSTLKVWNKTGFSLIRNQTLKNPWALTGHGNRLYATSNEKIMVLTKDGGTITVLHENGMSVYSLYVTDSTLYAADQGGTVRSWDTATFNNTGASQIFQYTQEKYQQLNLIQTVSYALLAASVSGLAILFLRDRHKKKVAAQAVPATPAQPPANPAPPSSPQQ